VSGSNNSEEPTRVTQPSPALASAIPGIHVTRELGRGGMAIVLEGQDLGFTPPRRVAVKLMSAELSADPEFRKRFQREASLVGEFRHDNIVHVYSCGEVRDVQYIVMEYLPGGTLLERMQHGTLEPQQAIDIALSLASALAYAHERDVIHRDIKPANVLFTQDEKAVLTDFGVAKITTVSASNLTRHAMVIGSTRYMSPEQERAEPVTDRADVYAWGLVLFEMLVGRTPIPRERVLRTAKEGVDIQKQVSAISGRIAQLICRCLLIDPEARPSAKECKAILSGAEISSVRSNGSRAKSLILRSAAVAAVAGLVASITYVAVQKNPLVTRSAAVAPVSSAAPASPAPVQARNDPTTLNIQSSAPPSMQVTSPAPTVATSSPSEPPNLHANPADGSASHEPSVDEVYQTMSSGQLARAQSMIEDVLKKHPFSSKAHFVAAQVYAKAQYLIAARNELATAARLDTEMSYVDAAALHKFMQQIGSLPQSTPSQPPTNPKASLRTRANEPSHASSASNRATFKILFMPNVNDYYPAAARRLGEEGRVVVKYCADVTGTAQSADVVTTSGVPSLDEAATRFALAARFQFVTEGSVPVASCANLPVKFELQNASPPTSVTDTQRQQ
jgi:TonB family protein